MTPTPYPRLAGLALLVLLLGGCGGEPEEAKPSGAARGGDAPAPQLPATARHPVVVRDWHELRPAGWRQEPPFAQDAVADLDDADPRALALLGELRSRWAQAPVVAALEGRPARLSGLVVPLTEDADGIRELLLVPYFGACIHVPPPPANQTIRVVTGAGGPYRGELFDTVRVEGTLHVEPFRGRAGDAGYRIDAVSISPYPQGS